MKKDLQYAFWIFVIVTLLAIPTILVPYSHPDTRFLGAIAFLLYSLFVIAMVFVIRHMSKKNNLREAKNINKSKYSSRNTRSLF